MLAAGSVGQEPEGMRAVQEAEAQVGRVETVQSSEWKVKNVWGLGNVMSTGWDKEEES